MTTFWAKQRTTVFGAIVVLVTAGVTAYALSAIAENDRRTSTATAATTTSLAQVEKGPRILFQHTGRDATSARSRWPTRAALGRSPT